MYFSIRLVFILRLAGDDIRGYAGLHQVLQRSGSTNQGNFSVSIRTPLASHEFEHPSRCGDSRRGYPRLKMTRAMPRAFTEITFTTAVRSEQLRRGTREICAQLEHKEPRNDVLADRAITFIESVDTAFIATTSSDGWPYVQHRGGPRGFIRVLSPTTIAFDDFDGNQQFITLGNLNENARMTVILMDFERRARLKLWGEATVIEKPLPVGFGRAPSPIACRHIVLHVLAWDFNCSKHIVQRSRPV